MFSANTPVLIVDDMSTMRKLVIRSLKSLGFTMIHEASDGNEALKVLEKEPIGLVISDWNMPNMTGLDLLKAVRARSNSQRIPFVLLTAEGEQAQVKEAILAGVDNYVLKPFSASTLSTKLEAVYKKYHSPGAA